jgi:hypothetical protein
VARSWPKRVLCGHERRARGSSRWRAAVARGHLRLARRGPISPEGIVQPTTNRSASSRILGWFLPDRHAGDAAATRSGSERRRHLVHALKAGCDFFVTTDDKTIVSKRAAVEARFSLKIRKPSELVAELATP